MATATRALVTAPCIHTDPRFTATADLTGSLAPTTYLPDTQIARNLMQYTRLSTQKIKDILDYMKKHIAFKDILDTFHPDRPKSLIRTP